MPLMPILALLFGWALQTPAPPVRVIFETELGSITFEVNVAKAPITAENFLKYVDGGIYDGGYINRSVRPDNTIRKDVEIQVIQFQRNRDKTKPSFPPIAMERTSVTGLTHLNGAMSMARSGPDSATASFSVVIGDQPSMDFGGKRNADGQGFAVFGRVIDGWEVIKKIHAAPTTPAGTQAAYGTETLAPVINVIKAYRAVK
jgi:peptidyl-prolyl cis-trans isomerase A (cyclophilin A)